MTSEWSLNGEYLAIVGVSATQPPTSPTKNKLQIATKVAHPPFVLIVYDNVGRLRLQANVPFIESVSDATLSSL
jgi:hypothetical protein